MIVICLEGCHGCGKSTLSTLFSSSGYKTLDEAFMDMPTLRGMRNQTVLMESIWVGNWFQRLFELGESEGGDEEEVYIADRSPFSAVCYAGEKGGLMEPVIRAQIEEVREASGIEVYSVHLKVEEETLWGRIQERLKREPGRCGLGEGSRGHMDKINGWYEGFDWDLTVDNTAPLVGTPLMISSPSTACMTEKYPTSISSPHLITPSPPNTEPTSSKEPT
ncbi:hypothetical protein TrRE_jg3117 [Triparma retinervis]|uniref:NadR/Ttd14 AAA domain-containing protein n=1 Tax=Triparma retinervis TaxID=2557542 RepID=A0A9W7DS67_9STRA|nr:hypothetical protein TrRE_jg3117 [Triparma retinervis]